MKIRGFLTSTLRWLLGLFFIFGALAEFYGSAIISGIASLLLALMLIPPSAKYLYSKIKKPIPRWVKFAAPIFLLFVMVSTSASSTPKTSPVQPSVVEETTPSATFNNRQRATVVTVTDGDTIRVDIDGVEDVVRVVGIDTPETVDPRKPVQCFGKEASDKMKSLVSGKTVFLEPDTTQGDRDKYERLLRFVFLEDGTDVGLTLIREGYAHEYTYNSNPYVYQAAYKEAEREARENNRGLWSSTACALTPTPTPTIKKANSATPTPTTIEPSTPTENSGGYSCTGPDLDCKDFNSHAEAQSFFDGCGFTATNDPMKLDSTGVGDGVACESS